MPTTHARNPQGAMPSRHAALSPDASLPDASLPGASHRFLVNGILHGVTVDAARRLQWFKELGGRVEILQRERDAIVSHDAVCDQRTATALLTALEHAGTAIGAHGVFIHGWEHLEPKTLQVGAAHAARQGNLMTWFHNVWVKWPFS